MLRVKSASNEHPEELTECVLAQKVSSAPLEDFVTLRPHDVGLHE